jgi:endonuclease/exonuclease/phosphatase family metal-dependent hydrolase
MPDALSSVPSSISRRGALAGLGALAASAAVGVTATPASAATRTWGGPAPLIGPAGGEKLHVMSFNIRFDKAGTRPGQPDHWPERAPLVEQLIRVEKPTILGVQEAEYTQLPAVEAGLGTNHRMLGFGRDGGSGGEYSAIFYDTRRLTALEWDQFWLSDAPDTAGSATWGNSVTRIVTWVRFADAASGVEFVAVNTHFDHESEHARQRSAAVLVELAGRFAGLPIVLTGDFNALAENSVAYSTLVSSGVFADTWLTAAKQLTPEWGTFPNYTAPVEGDKRIDWLLATPGDVVVHEAAISTWTKDGRWPSDHTPVHALLSFA